MSTHARLSPSGSYRWMTCPGSVAMEDGEPADSSEYSDEGTAAHALAAVCLKEGAHPAAYLGRILEVVNGVCLLGYEGPTPEKLRGHAEDIRREFEVDYDFAAGVNAYVQHIREYAGTTDSGLPLHELFIEQLLPIGHITGEEGAEGMGDAIIITADGDELQAHDLKFGMGVKVYAKANPQALLYLLGTLKKWPGNYSRFRVIIHQPRLNHLDEWDCDRATLDAFAQHAATRAGVAMMAFQTRKDWLPLGDSLALVPSDAACSFCKAKAKCPALAKHVTDTVGADFAVLGDLAVNGDTTISTMDLIPIDTAVLGLKLRAVDLIEDWCKAIRAKVEGALFEHGNSTDAMQNLGHKLVQGRKSNRFWSNDTEAEATLKHMRLKQDEMYTFKLITPTKAEAFLKEQPKRWAKVAPLIRQNDGKPSVAPLNDPRPALVLRPVADDFAVMGEPVPFTPEQWATVGETAGADLV